MNGGVIVFTMGNKPNKDWGSQDETIPVSEINDQLILPIPYSNLIKRSFTNQIKVELLHQFNGAEIYYTLNGNEPSNTTNLYEFPLMINETTTIKYFAEKEGRKSAVTELNLIKFPEGRNIKLNTKAHRQYTAGGDSALIDGITGNADFRTGSWQAYNGVDLDALVDLTKPTKVSYLSINFLQDINSWIFMPEYVEFFSSNDGKEFKSIAKVNNTVPENEGGSIVKDFTLTTSSIKTRYIRVLGKSKIMCPDWHKGHGNELFIFADEITIK